MLSWSTITWPLALKTSAPAPMPLRIVAAMSRDEEPVVEARMEEMSEKTGAAEEETSAEEDSSSKAVDASELVESDLKRKEKKIEK